MLLFQRVFVGSEAAPPAGLRASLPGLFIASLPGGSAAAPGLLPATRGGGGEPVGGFPRSDEAVFVCVCVPHNPGPRPAAPAPGAGGSRSPGGLVPPGAFGGRWGWKKGVGGFCGGWLIKSRLELSWRERNLIYF